MNDGYGYVFFLRMWPVTCVFLSEIYSYTPSPSEQTHVAFANHDARKTKERGEKDICHITHDLAD